MISIIILTMSLLDDFSGHDIAKLDQVDRDILSILQINGRASASYISEEIGMSIPTITERIKKLQDAGIVIGYAANINYNKVGLDVSAFITVISESSDHYNEVIKAANLMPEILQCFTTTGNGSHILLAITKNMSSLEKLLRTVQSWPGVMRTETQMILSSYKRDSALEIPKISNK